MREADEELFYRGHVQFLLDRCLVAGDGQEIGSMRGDPQEGPCDGGAGNPINDGTIGVGDFGGAMNADGGMAAAAAATNENVGRPGPWSQEIQEGGRVESREQCVVPARQDSP
jgi:hypothetical protein